MAMVLEEDGKTLRFDVPNSEANINAQHCGIKDRTVGMYYMSEQVDQCLDFLNDLDGEYFIDLAISVRNAKIILKILKEKSYQDAFKSFLNPQETAISALEWMLDNEKDFLYKMKAPFINDKQKYLKLDNEDVVVNQFKILILGDLVSLYIKKIGTNGYVFYIDKSPNFDGLIQNNEILKWMQ